MILKLLFVELILFHIIIGNIFPPNHIHLAEKILIENLDNYISTFESQITSLKGNLHEYQREHKNAEKDIVNYLSNPINAYLLTKRLTIDWINVQKLMKTDGGFETVQNITIESEKGNFPTEKNLNKVVVDLLNLQESYHLSIDEIVSGVFEGVKYSAPLTELDCFKIGMYLVYDNEEEIAIPWLQKSLDIISSKGPSSKYQNVKKANILDFLSWSHYSIGNYDKALEFGKAALELDPTLDTVNRNIKLIEDGIIEKREKHKRTPKLIRKHLHVHNE